MDVSLVVLLCVFTVSVVVHVLLSAWLFGRSLRTAQQTATMISSAMEVAKALEQTVAQRSSMADEVAALRQPLTESVAHAKILHEAVQKATAEMAGNLMAVPKMIEAICELGKRQVEIAEAVKNTASVLYNALHAKAPQANMQAYDPINADREYAIAELSRTHGIPRKEAEEHLSDERLWGGFNVTP